jgi:hypothetical protein
VGAVAGAVAAVGGAAAVGAEAGVAAGVGVVATASTVTAAVVISATAGAGTSARIIDREAVGVNATHDQNSNICQVRRSDRRA